MRERPLVKRVPLVVLDDHHDDGLVVAVRFVSCCESGCEPGEGAVLRDGGSRQGGMRRVRAGLLEIAVRQHGFWLSALRGESRRSRDVWVV